MQNPENHHHRIAAVCLVATPQANATAAFSLYCQHCGWQQKLTGEDILRAVHGYLAGADTAHRQKCRPHRIYNDRTHAG